MAFAYGRSAPVNRGKFPPIDVYVWYLGRNVWSNSDDISRAVGNVLNHGRPVRSFLSMFQPRHLDCNASGSPASGHWSSGAEFWNRIRDAFVPPNPSPVHKGCAAHAGVIRSWTHRGIRGQRTAAPGNGAD